MTVTVAAACTACGACIVTCPERALRPAPLRPAVDDVRCTDCLACLEVCPVDAILPDRDPHDRDPHNRDPHGWDRHPPAGAVHPIEVESYRILAEQVDLRAWPDGARQVVARMVHATADESFATSARVGEDAVGAAIAALRAGAPVICDSRMVLAGIPAVGHAACLLDEVPVAPSGDTRSAAAIRIASARHPAGALWVIGNAPTALAALVSLAAAGAVEPAAVIGLPVGYVGAAEAKERLWASPLHRVSVTNVGRRGGSPAAAGAANALNRLAAADCDRPPRRR